MAVALALANQILSLARPYNYPHATASADYSTMARSFAEHGLRKLRGVPIINNPPLGVRPNVYVHWPPLFPIALGFVFRAFGESEAAAHGFMLAVFIVSGILIYLLAACFLGKLGGMIALFGWMVIPVSASYSHLVVNLHPGFCLMLVSLFCFARATRASQLDRKWASLGCAAMGLAGLTSWEPLLACPGLLACAWWTRKQPDLRLAVVYTATAAVAFLGVIGWYAFQYPETVSDLLRVIRFRMKLGEEFSVDLNTVNLQQPSFLRLLVTYADRHIRYLGPLPLMALAWVVFSGASRIRSRSGGSAAVIFCGLLGPWWLWFLALPNHAYNHDYNLLLAVPAASMALAWTGVEAVRFALSLENSRFWGVREWTLLLLASVLMLQPLGESLYGRRAFAERGEGRDIKFALDIYQASGPGAVVMVPGASGAVVYYSRRHIVRYVDNDRVLEKSSRVLPGLFPGSPLYMAIPQNAQPNFANALQRYKIIVETPNLILLQVFANPAL